MLHGHFVNWPFFGPDATWHLPFLSFVTAACGAFAAGVGHLTNLPLASLQGPAAKAGVEAVSNAIDATANVILRIFSLLVERLVGRQGRVASFSGIRPIRPPGPTAALRGGRANRTGLSLLRPGSSIRAGAGPRS